MTTNNDRQRNTGELENTRPYIYLVQTVSANPAHDREIKRRIMMGWTAFGNHGDIMNNNLQLSLKKNIYKRPGTLENK